VLAPRGGDAYHPAAGGARMLRVRGLWTAIVALLAGACGGAGDGVTVALNWKPEPEFGGFYAAREAGLFEQAGLEVELTGGPGAPVVQMVVAGRATYGVISADELLIARERGDDLVAVFSIYQTSPLAILCHAERGAESLGELFALGGTLAVEPGAPYVRFLEKKYDLTRVKVVPNSYSIAPFLSAPDMAMQCFVTAEPIEARRRGADPRTFLVAGSGYNPYLAVVVTRGRLVREQPAEVERFVRALRAGWRRYLDDPGPTNEVMHALNPEMDRETFDLGAVAQHGLIEDDWTRAHGLGAMSVDRWRQLGEQLVQLSVLERAPEPADCFVELAPR
jgi:NitT/TauT family transport system substrate-binding protein